ncbi:MAG: TetR/AcrR family transcriptional regulator [Actinomycetota bacterium]
MAGPAGTSSSRKRVRLDYDDRRAQILGAARRLFVERPYSEVSMAELAEAAGVARGLLHHYFGSKRELYLAVVRQLVQVPTMPLPELDLDAENVWDLSVDGWMALIESNRDLWLAAIGAGGVGRDAELDEILDEARELTAERCLEALGIDPASASDEVRALVRSYGSMAEEITREWLARHRLTREQVRALLRAALPLLLDQLLPVIDAS